jgi:AraC family transcriptional regulator
MQVSNGLESGLSRVHPARISPDTWAATISASPELTTQPSDWPSALLRQWSNTSAEMDQPPLDHHYVVQHLGGAKQVTRWGGTKCVSTVVECGSLSFVTAGTNYRWRTQGPIKFAHLYLPPTLLNSTLHRLGKGNDPVLLDHIGRRDPLLEALMSAMLDEAQTRNPVSGLYMDSLLETFVIKLLMSYTNARVRPTKGSEVLPAFQLKRIVEFVDSNLSAPLTLDNLARIAGSSVFHFCRAFRNAVGEPPHAYVMRRRVARAAALLQKSDLTIDAIAADCGFGSAVHLTKTFTRWVGQTPRVYRRGRRAR